MQYSATVNNVPQYQSNVASFPANITQYQISMTITLMLQAIAVFISQPKIAKHLTKLELLAALTAAVAYLMLIVLIILIFNYVGILTDCDFSTQVCHDLDHPGVNEKYLVSTGSHLAGGKLKQLTKK